MDYIQGKLYRVKKDAAPLSIMEKGDVIMLLAAWSYREGTMSLEFIAPNGEVRRVHDRIKWVSDWLEGPL